VLFSRFIYTTQNIEVKKFNRRGSNWRKGRQSKEKLREERRERKDEKKKKK
jgi:hypothetical protein